MISSCHWFSCGILVPFTVLYVMPSCSTSGCFLGYAIQSIFGAALWNCKFVPRMNSVLLLNSLIMHLYGPSCLHSYLTLTSIVLVVLDQENHIAQLFLLTCYRLLIIYLCSSYNEPFLFWPWSNLLMNSCCPCRFQCKHTIRGLPGKASLEGWSGFKISK